MSRWETSQVTPWENGFSPWLMTMVGDSLPYWLSHTQWSMVGSVEMAWRASGYLRVPCLRWVSGVSRCWTQPRGRDQGVFPCAPLATLSCQSFDQLPARQSGAFCGEKSLEIWPCQKARCASNYVHTHTHTYTFPFTHVLILWNILVIFFVCCVCVGCVVCVCVSVFACVCACIHTYERIYMCRWKCT